MVARVRWRGRDGQDQGRAKVIGMEMKGADGGQDAMILRCEQMRTCSLSSWACLRFLFYRITG
jgi:hypothetical protein